MTLTLPILPEIELEPANLQTAKAQLLELRESLHQVCKDVDERLRSLESFGNEHSKQVSEWEAQAFRSAPTVANHDEKATAGTAQPAPAPMETRMVMEASSPIAMSEDLEQTTLEELNAALAKAFAQMAGRMVW